MRYAIYARYSSDRQSERSIEDQVRLCRERITAAGGTVARLYSDAAISGAHAGNRPGLQQLLLDARAARFDVVMTEALDRLSRDQEDIAGIFKRLSHAGIAIMTIAEGAISELHVGLKGTMNALFLKDLAEKTRRGQRGSVEGGLIPGGLTYGYDLVRELGAAGRRVINEDQKRVVVRIFTEYAGGKNTREIAIGLNRDGIPGPRGGTWRSTTIGGHHKRRSGILHNELYIGRIVYNRQHFVKDPDTGRRTARVNPEMDWTIKEVPELRIVPQDLWDRAHAVMGNHGLRGGVIVRRPKRLLSGLLVCSECGGPLSMVRGDDVGCSNHKYRGTCSNGRLASMTAIEARVLARMKANMLAPDMVAQIVREVEQALRAQDEDRGKQLASLERQAHKVSAEIDRIVTAISRGLDTPAMGQRLRELEERKVGLERDLATQPTTNVVRLLPSLADDYREMVEEMHRALADRDGAAEAAALMREMISRVVVTPKPERGQVALKVDGRLGELLGLVSDEGRERMVAGARYQPFPTTKVWSFEA